MGKSKRFLSILIPGATVFVSSCCVMMLEIVAGRLLARYIGASLYTWTAVIGVVLGGITIGNYAGGRFADAFNPRKTLAVLFGLCSIACVATIVMNNLIGEWTFLWRLGLPARVFSHVLLVFLLPSALLGMISPVVAKMALDKGLPKGRTVGDIYAWGAAGSIAGTFLAGFYLIAMLGTTAIIWVIAAVLLFMGILYQPKLLLLHLWAVILVLLMVLGMAPGQWPERTGSKLALRKQPDARLLYEVESQYSYVAVRQLSKVPDKRQLIQDNMKNHSRMVMGNIRDLELFYTEVYAAVTHRVSNGKDKLSILAIGGGGYVFPRYVEQFWPGSRVDVVEIDPAVTRAATEAFGLEKDATINTINADGRNFVDELARRQRSGEQIPRYDFVYGDAFNDLAVPWQLVTREFDSRVSAIMAADGVYMVNIVDMYDSGRFLGSFLNTIECSFPFVYVVSRVGPRTIGNNFVVIAGKRALDLQGLGQEEALRERDLWILSESEIKTLRDKADGIILTDDYAPVENMLAPVALSNSKLLLAQRYLDEAGDYRQAHNWDTSVSKCKAAIAVCPEISINAYNEMARTLVKQAKPGEAIAALEDALKYNEQAKVKSDMTWIHYSLGMLLKRDRRYERASEHFGLASAGLAKKLGKEPGSVEAAQWLCDVLIANISIGEGTANLEEVIAQLKKSILYMRRRGDDSSAEHLETLVEYIEQKVQQSGRN